MTPPALSLGIDRDGSVDARDRGRVPLWRFVRDSGLHAVVLGTSKDPNAKVTTLLVSPRSRRPVLAVKAPTTDVAAVAVAAETRVLRELRAVVSSPLVDTIPEVLATVEHDGREALVATALEGRPMTSLYMGGRRTARRAIVQADFASVGAWVAALQESTAGAVGPLDLDDGVARRLASRFDGDPGLDEDLERLAVIHERLRRHAVARTAVHGDLWLGNVLMTGRTVGGVVDWEAGGMDGQPVRDLVRFAHMYALYLDCRTRRGRPVRGHRGLRSGEWGAGVLYALDGDGWFPELFRGFVADGLRRLGAPPTAWRDAALAGIAEVAALTDDPLFARRHLVLFRRAVNPHPARRP